MKHIVLVFIVLMCGLVVFSTRKILDPQNEREMLMDMAYLPNGRMLGWVSGGMDDALSDILWLRSMRYVMDRFGSDKDYTYLYRVYDIITDFDPNFVRAYRFGSYFLTGVTDEYEHARDLLRKGWDNNPGKWEIAYDLGSVYNLNLRDPISAAEWFGRGAKVPGSPSWLGAHAQAIFEEEGRLELALDMWVNIFESTESGGLREVAEWNVKRVQSLIVIEKLKKFVEEYRIAGGGLPEALADLVGAGLIAVVPQDAYGEDFLYFPSIDEGEWPEIVGDGQLPFRIECKELMRRILDKRLVYLTRVALAPFKREYGSWPASLGELVEKSDVVETVPSLPYGVKLKYDPDAGKFHYDRELDGLI